MLQKFDASFRFFLILTATFVRSSSVYDYRVFLRQTVLAPSVSLASKGIQKGGVREFVTKHNRYANLSCSTSWRDAYSFTCQALF